MEAGISKPMGSSGSHELQDTNSIVGVVGAQCVPLSHGLSSMIRFATTVVILPS